MMPVPRPKRQEDGTFKVEPCDECSVSVIRAIRDDSIAMGHPFLMLGVCNYMRDIIEEHFPDTFDIKARPRLQRLYLHTRQADKSFGKETASKRNHINKFKNLILTTDTASLRPTLFRNASNSNGSGAARRKMTTEMCPMKTFQRNCAQ